MADAELPTKDPPIKGRGSFTNREGRFERRRLTVVHDEWTDPDDVGGARPATVIEPANARKIITTNDSPDVPFDRSINPYQGCEHGCVYCFARPSHAYLGLSAGLDFETRIFSKPNAAELLRHQLGRPSYEPAPLALGANTDAYQPAERRLGITRSVLEVLAEHCHPVGILTKSELVLRDVDLLSEMATQRLAHVFVSITTLDGELARRMEPRAAAPHRRLEIVRALSNAGVPTGVLVSPMIPALNDHELDRILAAAREAGATRAGTILLRLPHELRELFEEWLEAHYPLRKDRVLRRVREARGGKLNDPRFGSRMRGRGHYASMLQARFAAATRRLGFARGRFAFDLSQFRRPNNHADKQLRLF